ncbi:MAG: TonB-dependent receptor plug domain-containing protein, partial [Treponema sp.]|nr:TonB-dependent receptor plug domain-containing protein [Treponema sp.]
MFHLKFFSCLFLVGLLLCPAGIHSQNSFDEEEPFYHEDEYLDLDGAGGIVISASRTPESAAGVPAQVTVITAEDIAASGAVNITDVLELVPGIRFSGGLSGAGSEAISMRGFGENSYGRVLILLDGNKLNNPDMKAANWNAIPLSDVERIEVMDGSASVQYGNYAVGGVINIITKKSGEKRTLIGLSGGNYFTHKEYISHFSPLKWGSFSLSAENGGTRGYRERQSSRSTNVMAGADWEISEKLNLSFNASFSDLFFQLPGSLTKEQFEDDPKKALTSDGSPNFNDENSEYHFSGGFGLQWLPRENIEINLPLSYIGKIIKSDMASQKNYTYDPLTWEIDEYLGDSYINRTIHAAEARPQGMISFKPGGMPLRFLGGVDIYYSALEGDTYYHKNRTDKWNSSFLSQWTIGPYLTARFSPVSNFSLSAGARFDMAAIDAQNMDSTVDDNKFYSAFVYDAGMVYNPIK